LRREFLGPKIAEHKGRIVKTTGDGLLVEFASVVDAVRCAVEVQQAIPERDTGVAADNRIELRIGINLGDVIVEGDDLYGDGVNIAARIEALADAGGICVSRVVYDQVRDKLDISFEDLGEQQVKNIARPVHVYRVQIAASVHRSPLPNPPPLAGEGRVGVLALPDKPSIAVLPFANMSRDPEQEYFADGMVEEIITALSRIRWLFVIARNSSFTYKGQAVDVKQVGRELGVRYVLEGSVRKAGGVVRITAQLIDATNGAHLWADRFDGSPDEIFELQDNVAFSVAGVIESTLQAAEIKRSTERPTSDLTAYDLYLRALPNCYAWDKERILAALGLLEGAIKRDPQFGPALALAGICHHHLEQFSAGKDSGDHRRSAIELARRALQAAPEDPGTVANAGFLIGVLEGAIEPAITLVDRALSLNPSFERGWRASAWLRLNAGQLDVAVQHIETAMRLSPRFGNATDTVLIGCAHFFQRRFDDAIFAYLTAREQMPKNPAVLRYLAVCYAQAGRLKQARQMLDQLRTITPVVMPTLVPFRNPEHRELYLSGLHLAVGEAET
jgi:adenylate cyclase